jgi:hypothetical protein
MMTAIRKFSNREEGREPGNPDNALRRIVLLAEPGNPSSNMKIDVWFGVSGTEVSRLSFLRHQHHRVRYL